jgi:hypothetical protein
VTDDAMRARLGGIKAYTAALLMRTPKLVRPDVNPIVWEHARRNMALVEQGVLAIVAPAADDGDLAGLYVFDASPDEVRAILDHDPGVQAGIFTYEVCPVRAFPGAALA